VSSRAAALPETTRELAQYYEPADDPSALADKLLNVLNSPPPLAERTRIQQAVREAYDYRVIAGEYWAELSRLARGC